MVQLIIVARCKPLRHRLNTLAIAGAAHGGKPTASEGTGSHDPYSKSCSDSEFALRHQQEDVMSESRCEIGSGHATAGRRPQFRRDDRERRGLLRVCLEQGRKALQRWCEPINAGLIKTLRRI